MAWEVRGGKWVHGELDRGPAPSPGTGQVLVRLLLCLASDRDASARRGLTGVLGPATSRTTAIGPRSGQGIRSPQLPHGRQPWTALAHASKRHRRSEGTVAQRTPAQPCSAPRELNLLVSPPALSACRLLPGPEQSWPSRDWPSPATAHPTRDPTHQPTRKQSRHGGFGQSHPHA